MSYLQQGGSGVPYGGFQSRVMANYAADTPPPLSTPALPGPPSTGGQSSFGGAAGINSGLFGTASIPPSNSLGIQEEGKIFNLVIELMDASTRESALLELSKRREQYDDLALVLWHSFGEYSFMRLKTVSDTKLQESCLPFCKRLCPSTRCSPHQTSQHMFRIGSVTPSLFCSA